MDSTLHALSAILIRAIPTFLLVLILHFYLKKMFFEPLGRVLAERDAATKGARAQAEASLAKAAKLAGEYEESMRSARGEIYREQEEMRRAWRNEQSEAMQAARLTAQGHVAAAKADLAKEADLARRTLAADMDAIATQIAGRMMGRRAA
jgi:F-type H+-transporting ATPase subunit b